ncbi:39S ribosomal protein L39-like protein, partial [Leptotrombidium deliense]
EVRKARNELFDEEKKKHLSVVPRVEKIEVVVKDAKPDDTVTLMMNRYLSTPYNCAQHLHELYAKRSLVAEIDDKMLWDMHRPLTDNCTLKFRHLQEADVSELNRIFWRSCSFLLGMVVDKTFKDDIPVTLHSWPKPNVKSGSFVYDIQLPTLQEWKPNEAELRTLTATFWKMRQAAYKFERLSVSLKVAKEIFSDNQFKLQQLNSLKEEEDPKVTIYRVNDHIDFSIGPMIPNTSFIGRVSVTAVHPITVGDLKLYRFQAVAVPTEQRINHFAFKVLMDRAAKLNKTAL